MPSYCRAGSRSPRRDQAHNDSTDYEPEMNMECGLPRMNGEKQPAEVSQVLKDIKLQGAYLKQFLDPPRANPQNVPHELRAGVPLEPGRQLLGLVDDQSAAPELGVRAPAPWSGLPAHEACFAVALRLFSILTPQLVSEDRCSRFCGTAAAELASMQCESTGSRGGRDACLFEAASTSGLSAKAVSSAVESLDVMLTGEAAVCCCLVDDYVAVLEDPDTGEEIEREIGAHCLLILGGDLLGGPSYIVFDPWTVNGSSSGDLSYWASHTIMQASPSAWIELSPLPLKVPVAAPAEAATVAADGLGGYHGTAPAQAPETALGD